MFVTVGIVNGTFGVRGELRVVPASDHPDRMQTLAQAQAFIYLRGIRDPYRIRQIEQRRDLWYLCLDGIETREQAQSLIGGELQIPKHMVLPLPPGEFYIFQIIGLQVESETGEILGRVVDVLQPGANDVYVMHDLQGREFLIPATKQVVRHIDLQSQRMIVRPLPGLFDDEGDPDAH